MKKIFIIFTLIIILLIFNKKKNFLNNINTLYSKPKFYNIPYWIDYYCNFKKHYSNLQNILKNYIDNNKLLLKNDKDYLYKNFPLEILITIYFYEKHNLNLYTMMPKLIVNNLISHIKNTKYVDGSMVDVGCWKGGSSIIMKYFNSNKKLYILDIFDSMDNKLITKNYKKKDIIFLKLLSIINNYFDNKVITTNIQTVKNNFKKLNVSLDNVEFIKGNLNNKNFKFDKIKKISLLRIDCDFYLPTYNVLKNLYPKVQKKGIIIFDDFNINFVEERSAVIDYFKKYNINHTLYHIGQSAYIIKN